MPHLPEECGAGCAEQPLPQGKAREHGDKISDPQLPTADAEAAKEPGPEESKSDHKLGQEAQAFLQRPQQVCPGANQQAGEKPADSLTQNHLRRHRHIPRFCRGVS